MRLLMFFGLMLASVSANAEPVSYADTVEKLLPSVVSVSSVKADGETPDLVKALRGSPFEHFFSEHYRDGNFDAPKSILLGSGFVYDAKGHILTSAHVVESLDEVRVTLNDGSVVSAKVAGRDAKTDIALLKADNPHALKPVKIGDSDTARVGDAVLAIGNPFGLGNTVTSGIVSARSRDIQVGPYDDFIQTDAAINRGNSGGPLFNVKGELIGVNTAIFSPSGGSVGIAFAAPSNIVKAIADALIKDGVVRRGRLGLKVQSVSPELAKSLKLPKAYGAYVSEVENPKTTVKQGDVIVSFNGREVPSMRALPKMAAFAPVGSTAGHYPQRAENHGADCADGIEGCSEVRPRRGNVRQFSNTVVGGLGNRTDPRSAPKKRYSKIRFGYSDNESGSEIRCRSKRNQGGRRGCRTG